MDQQPVETTLYSLSETPPLAPERRTGDRYLSLFRVGTLTIGERRELCLIKNVSAGGMMIRPYCPIPIGTHLSVALKQGEPVHGTALWDKDDCIGVTFDEPIDSNRTPFMTVQLNFGHGRNLIAAHFEILAMTGTDDGSALPPDIIAIVDSPSAPTAPGSAGGSTGATAGLSSSVSPTVDAATAARTPEQTEKLRAYFATHADGMPAIPDSMVKPFAFRMPVRYFCVSNSWNPSSPKLKTMSFIC